MSWLSALDTDLFRLLNQLLVNPLFDRVIPFFSGNSLFVPAVVLIVAAILCKGGRRGRVFVVVLLIALSIGDGLVSNSLKKAFARPRPCHVVPDTRQPGGAGCSDTGSLPSAHSFNSACVALVAMVFYRRTARILFPLALLVGYSRIYTGVHYPGDVMIGLILGAGHGAAMVLGLDRLWARIGPRWFPAWWPHMPSLLDPDRSLPPASVPPTANDRERTWLSLGCALALLLCVGRLLYLASGLIELSEDEAYQWTWSKHLALSYYSKPPMIAYTQFLGTSLWGDTAFGVRFFSPVISLVMSLLLLRFMAREVSARAGAALLLAVTTAPLISVGSTLMTIDPLNVLFWTTAMLSGWRAIQNDGRIADWLWTGLWMGLGFLSKYTALFQLASWVLVFMLWPPARKHLRTAGPWMALGVMGLCTVPVLVWNAQHGWITVTHLSERGNLDQAWHFTLKYLGEFVGSEFGLLNPVFFIGATWAALGFWRKLRHHPLAVYSFAMGLPLFLFYLLFTLRARVLPNWIAPAVIPLFLLMIIYWRETWDAPGRRVRVVFFSGLIAGVTFVILMHDTHLTEQLFHRPIPPKLDPLKRVRGWSETARVVGAERDRLAREGPDAFIIGDHYGITGEISFYLPEARTAVTSERPLVYYQSSDVPHNQFFFFPGYRDRKGANAIYIQQAELPKLATGWFPDWLAGRAIESRPPDPPKPPPVALTAQFRRVTDLGFKEIIDRHRVIRRVQLFECRDLQ